VGQCTMFRLEESAQRSTRSAATSPKQRVRDAPRVDDGPGRLDVGRHVAEVGRRAELLLARRRVALLRLVDLAPRPLVLLTAALLLQLLRPRLTATRRPTKRRNALGAAAERKADDAERDEGHDRGRDGGARGRPARGRGLVGRAEGVLVGLLGARGGGGGAGRAVRVAARGLVGELVRERGRGGAGGGGGGSGGVVRGEGRVGGRRGHGWRCAGGVSGAKREARRGERTKGGTAPPPR